MRRELCVREGVYTFAVSMCCHDLRSGCEAQLWPVKWRVTKGPNALEVRTSYPAVLWPWSGHLAVDIWVADAAADFHGVLCNASRQRHCRAVAVTSNLPHPCAKAHGDAHVFVV